MTEARSLGTPSYLSNRQKWDREVPGARKIDHIEPEELKASRV